MNQQIVLLTSANYVPYSGNKFTYKFPGNLTFKDAEIAIKKAQLYNCTYNISSSRGNNTFSITWIDDTVYNYTIRDGYYSISEISYYISNCMLNDNLYTSTTGSSSPSAYIQLDVDSTGYGSVFTFSIVPTSSQASSAGVSVRSAATWSFPPSTKHHQLHYVVD
jgi:hypothetical protein